MRHARYVPYCLPKRKKSRYKNTDYTRSAGISISLPWINSYSYHDYNRGIRRFRTGFVGLGLSGYNRNKANKLAINIAWTADLPAPVGPVDFGKTGTRSSVSAFIVEGNFHHALHKHFGFITGVNYVTYGYHFVDYDSPINMDRYDRTVGLTTGLEYLSAKHFLLAVFYRPAIVQFQTRQYWSVLSVDVRFDLPVWKK
jgi:hypothetical protein